MIVSAEHVLEKCWTMISRKKWNCVVDLKSSEEIICTRDWTTSVFQQILHKVDPTAFGLQTVSLTRLVVTQRMSGDKNTTCQLFIISFQKVSDGVCSVVILLFKGIRNASLMSIQEDTQMSDMKTALRAEKIQRNSTRYARFRSKSNVRGADGASASLLRSTI